ncbi:hypothetical protein chiPu_0027426, partial [Chiloscyllium punctatum]|nr:hypothetical protein [Chiloscyllium punctatum]
LTVTETVTVTVMVTETVTETVTVGLDCRTLRAGDTMTETESPSGPRAQQNGSPSNQLTRRPRSTKGASKLRRDLINSEIRSMRDLLPLVDEERQHLSYLQTMALVTSFLHKALSCPGKAGST